MLKSYQAVLFDMDGLIVDTETLYFQTYNQTLNEQGVDISQADYVRCVGHPVADNSANAVTRYALPVRPEDFLHSWMTRFEAAIADPAQIALMPGFLDLLAHLQTAGYKLGIASSTPRHRMQSTLQNGVLPHIHAAAIRDIFGAVLSGSDVAHLKPDPEIYLKAAAKLNVAPKACVVFEDSAAGVQAGKTAGMTVFAVPNFFTAHQNHDAADRILPRLDAAIAFL